MPESTSSSGPDRISFAEPARPRRFSNATTGTDNEFEQDVSEDWTKTTHEKDSWAARERRRSNKFAAIDNDVALQKLERSRSGRNGSTSLGIFSQGVDKHGNAVLLSDDTHDDWDVPVDTDDDPNKKTTLLTPSMAAVLNKPDERRLSMSSQNSDKRRGSVLSLWKTGKDRNGLDHVHAGHEEGEDGENWDEAASEHSGDRSSQLKLVPTTSSSSRSIRDDRRGSVLSIWKQGTDRDGHTVIMSGEEHDAIEPVLDADGNPVPVIVEKKEMVINKNGAERIGSVLSIWAPGTDKDGKTVIHSGEEHDGVIEIPAAPVSPTLKAKGTQDRRGSVLSMWTEEDRRDTQERPAAVKLVADA